MPITLRRAKSSDGDLQTAKPGGGLGRSTSAQEQPFIETRLTQSRFERLVDFECYSVKQVTFTVHVPESSASAQGGLTVWRNNPRQGLPDYADFAYATDDNGGAGELIGMIVASGWYSTDQHPLDFGNIILFDRLTIKNARAVDTAAIWAEINRLITSSFGPASVLLLKAFPLEFEKALGGDGADASMRRTRFAHRRTAMMRHYRKALGVDDVKGHFENDGWMYRLLRCPVEPTWSHDLSCMTEHLDSEEDMAADDISRSVSP